MISKTFQESKCNFRVVKTVFLENGVFVPYRKQEVLTKNGKNDDVYLTHKNKGLCSETDENDENGGERFHIPLVLGFGAQEYQTS